MNLLARKRQLVIAKQGADLLRKKRAIGVLWSQSSEIRSFINRIPELKVGNLIKSSRERGY
jgi:vacuolar-type H+-ATPase subunit D/Vma8